MDENVTPFPTPSPETDPESLPNSPSALSEKAQKIIDQCSSSGEPVFILRAKDIFSPMVIKKYIDLVADYGPNDHEFQEEVLDIFEAFRSWQHKNVQQVRYPD